MQTIFNTAFLCNIHTAYAVQAGIADLPDSISEHNAVNELSLSGLIETANNNEFISCTAYEAGSYTEQTHNTLNEALATISNDSDLTAYVYTCEHSTVHGLLFITYNKP